MKKRMFLSTILMTLVLLVAVTTATFAWYQATAGSITAEMSGDVSINAVTEEIQLGGMKIVITAAPGTGVGPTCYDKEEVNGVEQEAGAKFYTVAGSAPIATDEFEYKDSEEIVLSYVIKDAEDAAIVTLTEEQKAMLSGKTFTISMSGAGVRFGATADAAVEGTTATGTATLTFSAAGVGSFTKLYYAINSSVTAGGAIGLTINVE